MRTNRTLDRFTQLLLEGLVFDVFFQQVDHVVLAMAEILENVLQLVDAVDQFDVVFGPRMLNLFHFEYTRKSYM
jgi:hypothetical protein